MIKPGSKRRKRRGWYKNKQSQGVLGVQHGTVANMRNDALENNIQMSFVENVPASVAGLHWGFLGVARL